MRRLLIRSVLSVLALAILAAAWIVAGPWWARALDAINTTRLAGNVYRDRQLFNRYKAAKFGAGGIR